MTSLQNAAMLEELEKAEAVAKKLEIKVKMLEKTATEKDVEVKLKEEELMKEVTEYEEDTRILEEVIEREVRVDAVWDLFDVFLFCEIDCAQSDS